MSYILTAESRNKIVDAVWFLLSRDTDHARFKNRMGFNKGDSKFFHIWFPECHCRDDVVKWSDDLLLSASRCLVTYWHTQLRQEGFSREELTPVFLIGHGPCENCESSTCNGCEYKKANRGRRHGDLWSLFARQQWENYETESICPWCNDPHWRGGDCTACGCSDGGERSCE